MPLFITKNSLKTFLVQNKKSSKKFTFMKKMIIHHTIPSNFLIFSESLALQIPNITKVVVDEVLYGEVGLCGVVGGSGLGRRELGQAIQDTAREARHQWELN